MIKISKPIINKLSFLVCVVVFFVLPTIVSASGYAWSESVGYFDFSYMVVSDSILTGYAYNDNTGFLNLTGVSNDGSGILSGYAWSESVGYFDFSDVVISNGAFSGYAYNDNTGFLNMDGVTTTWSPAVAESDDDNTPRRISGYRRVPFTQTDSSQTDIIQRLNTQSDQISKQDLKQIIENLISLNMIPADKLELARKMISDLSSETVFFTQNLYLGIVDEEVRLLQKFLNQNSYTIAESGPGSLNNETNIFGSLTQKALIKFQQTNNINPAIGYFGPITRTVINNLLNK